LYTIALFISLVIFGCCFFNKLDSSIGGITSMFGASGLVQTFNFGNILLHSLIMTFLIAGLYIFVRFALIKIFNKASDPKTIFIDSFIDFSVNSTPTIVLFVIGGILAFISYYIAIFAIILVLIFYITVLVRGAIENIPEMKNEGLFNIVTALFITIAIAIFTYVAYQMLIATALSTVSSTQSYLNNIGSSFLDGLFG
ncbi:MAG: hypothetical protein J1E41_06990, partial [Ruminococcus sp.]|nr:hypothetical protein [Ruminococcus sp.]